MDPRCRWCYRRRQGARVTSIELKSGRRFRGLLSIPRIDHNGDRSVVDEGDFHVGAEHTRANGSTEVYCQLSNKCFVVWNCNFWWSGADVGWAIPFFRTGEQSKLADDEDFAADILNREIHGARLIIEDPELDNLSAQPLDVLIGIACFDGKEHQESTRDDGMSPAGDCHRCFRHPLDDGAHVGDLV